jgi:hypothetical protein
MKLAVVASQLFPALLYELPLGYNYSRSTLYQNTLSLIPETESPTEIQIVGDISRSTGI